MSSFIEVDKYVSHVNLGLCKIKRIDRKTVGSVGKDFITMNAVTNDCMAMVPLEEAERFIRPLKPIGVIDSHIDSIKGPVRVDDTTWNRRYRDLSHKMSLGRFTDWLYVAVELLSIRLTKDLSFGERKMLDACCEKMGAEIAVQSGQSLTDAVRYLREALEQRVGNAVQR